MRIARSIYSENEKTRYRLGNCRRCVQLFKEQAYLNEFSRPKNDVGDKWLVNKTSYMASVSIIRDRPYTSGDKKLHDEDCY
jgi:hypothetical protein